MTYQLVMRVLRPIIAAYLSINSAGTPINMVKTDPDGATASDLTHYTKSTTPTSILSGASRRHKKKWNRQHGTQINMAGDTFKGANDELKGKVFVKGPSQAAKYDEAYKALIIHFRRKYDQRVYRAFEHKDTSVGRKH